MRGVGAAPHVHMGRGFARGIVSTALDQFKIPRHAMLVLAQVGANGANGANALSVVAKGAGNGVECVSMASTVSAIIVSWHLANWSLVPNGLHGEPGPAAASVVARA